LLIKVPSLYFDSDYQKSVTLIKRSYSLIYIENNFLVTVVMYKSKTLNFNVIKTYLYKSLYELE